MRRRSPQLAAEVTGHPVAGPPRKPQAAPCASRVQLSHGEPRRGLVKRARAALARRHVRRHLLSPAAAPVVAVAVVAVFAAVAIGAMLGAALAAHRGGWDA